MTTTLRAEDTSVALPPRRRHGGHRLPLVDRASPYLSIAPFFVVFCVFGLFPLVFTMFVSLHNWNPLGDRTFIGLDNYTELLADDRFWTALRNTLSIWVLSTVPQLLLALGLAHLLNDSRLKARSLFRMVLLVPNITSVVAVAVVFSSIFGRDFGIINWVLTSVGLDKVDFTATAWASHLAIATMIMWRWTGYNALIYLAGMQSISQDLYEAAEIDGAGRWRQFVSVTIPQLRNTIIFTVVVSTIGGLQIFAEPLLFQTSPGLTGGNARQFSTVTLFMYEQGFSGAFRFGYASAIAVVLLVVIACFAVVNFLVSNRMAGRD